MDANSGRQEASSDGRVWGDVVNDNQVFSPALDRARCKLKTGRGAFGEALRRLTLLGPAGRQPMNSARLLILLALPRGIEPLFQP